MNQVMKAVCCRDSQSVRICPHATRLRGRLLSMMTDLTELYRYRKATLIPVRAVCTLTRVTDMSRKRTSHSKHIRLSCRQALGCCTDSGRLALPASRTKGQGWANPASPVSVGGALIHASLDGAISHL